MEEEFVAEIDRLRASRIAARNAILDMAARQDAFAEPPYSQMSDADRQMFRHAAKMLREAVERHLKD